MPEAVWRNAPETIDVCVEGLADLPRPSCSHVAALLGLLAMGLALAAMGAWILVVG